MSHCKMMVAVLSVMMLATSNIAIKSEKSDDFYLIHFDSKTKINILRKYNIKIVEDYKSFVLAKMSREKIKILINNGFDVIKYKIPKYVLVGRYKFDPLKDMPRIPKWAEIDTKLYILQFLYPIKHEYLEKIKSTGAKITKIRFAENCYIIISDENAYEKIKNMKFIRWIGKFYPNLKFRSEFENKNQDVEIMFLKYHYVRDIYEDEKTPWGYYVKGNFSLKEIKKFSKMNDVIWIEKRGKIYPRNDVTRWVIQSFDERSESTPIWEHGLHGEGIIIGMADSGIDYDHAMFRNSTNDYGIPGENHRKIVWYNTSIDDWDYYGHGTHVAGTLAGDNILNMGFYDKYDGIAYRAKIAFFDIVKENVWSPPSIRKILQDAYSHGARSHSDSWGEDTTSYTLRSEKLDQFQWEHSDFLSFIAAGNSGPNPGTILEPANAKNVVSVGASEQGNTTNVASFSSRGLTEEGLIAPTVIAPGVGIYSADGDGVKGSYNAGITVMGGTSTSTPAVAAAGALIEQYFRDGYYPKGYKGCSKGFMPSGPLIKAVLVCGAWDQYGGDGVKRHIPDIAQGWGKVHLDNSLYFMGDKLNLWIHDNYNEKNETGLATGEYLEYYITANSSQPLKVVLVWNDYPGKGLINNLDLYVISPDGARYRGNIMRDGSSVPNITTDSKNNVEVVVIKKPKSGQYTIRVVGVNIGGSERQRFALAVTGALFDPHVAKLKTEKGRYAPYDEIKIILEDIDLYEKSVAVEVQSTTEAGPERVILNKTSEHRYEGSIKLILGEPKFDNNLQVAEDDVATILYYDANPGMMIRTSCIIDGVPPRIFGITVENVTHESFYVSASSNELSKITITVENISRKYSSDFSLNPSVFVYGLEPEKIYRIRINATDDLGNKKSVEIDEKISTIKTYSLSIESSSKHTGWVSENEASNYIGKKVIWCGYYRMKEHVAIITFKTSNILKNVSIEDAVLRVMTENDDYLNDMHETIWYVDILPSDSYGIFNWSLYSPNYTTLMSIKGKTSESVISQSSLIEDKWLEISLKSVRKEIEDCIKSNYLMIRIRIRDKTFNNLAIFYCDVQQPQLLLNYNYPPYVISTAPRTIKIYEDSKYDKLNLKNVFYDDDVLSYSTISHYPGSGMNLSVSVADDGSTVISPVHNWYGFEDVVFACTDNFEKTATHTIRVFVKELNDPPVITYIGGKKRENNISFDVMEDERFRMLISAEDADGDDLTYYTNDSIVKFEDEYEGIISFTATNEYVGVRIVAISVTDGKSTDTVSVIFRIHNTNDPPIARIISPHDGMIINVSSEILLDGGGSDDDDIQYGDALLYIWTSNVSGELGRGEKIKVRINETGEHRIKLLVIDSFGSYSSESVSVIVRKIATPPPYPPEQKSKKQDRSKLEEVLIEYYGLIMFCILVGALLLGSYEAMRYRRF